MPSAQHTVMIRRPLDEVFAFFTGPANEVRWRSTIKEIAPEGPAAVGTRVHQVMKGPGGLSVPADVEVTGYEPMSRYAFRGVSGPVRPEGEFLFSGDGAQTTVSFSLTVARPGEGGPRGVVSPVRRPRV
jgi:uncharacterized membrane protein